MYMYAVEEKSACVNGASVWRERERGGEDA